jgi:release factor glutamine methyltransferase
LEYSITIRDALRDARQQIDALDAHVLLGEVLGVDRATLIAEPERPLTPEQAARFADYMARCAAGEPVAYILGRRAFYDRDFLVTPAVLIPRPETELLLEQALVWSGERLTTWAGNRPITAADIGTGSGALAVTFAALRPQAQVCAVDISPAALAVAQQNAERQQTNVTFYEGDLLTPLIERGIKLDLIMANLPYIASDEVPGLAVSRYEPRLALDGGADGLDLIRRLLTQTPPVAKPGALILLEIGAGQGSAALALTQSMLQPQRAALILDYAGLDRIIRAEL